mmetsp:Transcript_904/g.5691  ORF Transcript_904/g.5691 Transcript_904/m.5691 type:complete len:137 (+) Transcript_904:4856-5266(+)
MAMVAWTHGAALANGSGWRNRKAKRCARVHARKEKFATFEDLLERSGVPVLVDFYATWCGPCQMMGPILSEVQKNLAGTVQVVKIDTEKYPQLASKYGIQALPTLVLFKRGNPVDRIEGVLDSKQLTGRVRMFLDG